MPARHESIDVSFDVRSDTPPGKDPDSHSKTLKRYHQMLWSKPLPDGRRLSLSDTTRNVYLHQFHGPALSPDLHSYVRYHEETLLVNVGSQRPWRPLSTVRCFGDGNQALLTLPWVFWRAVDEGTPLSA